MNARPKLYATSAILIAALLATHATLAWRPWLTEPAGLASPIKLLVPAESAAAGHFRYAAALEQPPVYVALEVPEPAPLVRGTNVQLSVSPQQGTLWDESRDSPNRNAWGGSGPLIVNGFEVTGSETRVRRRLFRPNYTYTYYYYGRRVQ